MEDNNKNKTEGKKVSSSRGSNKDYPLILLKKSEEVLKVVYDSGRKATPQTISIGLGGLTGGGLSRRIASAKRWGLISGIGTVSVTDLGMDILHPTEEDPTGNKARKRAFMQVPVLEKIYKRFGEKIPETEKIFVSVLVKEFHFPEKDAKTTLGIYKEAIKNYLSYDEGDIEEVELKKDLKIQKKDKSNGNKEFNNNIFDLIEQIFELNLEIKTSFDHDRIKEIISKILALSNEEKIISVTSYSNNILTDFDIVTDQDTLKKLTSARVERILIELKKELGYEEKDRDHVNESNDEGEPN